MLNMKALDRIEQNIRDRHPEDFPGERVIAVEWVGETEHAGEPVDFFRVDTTGGSYRYYTNESHAIVDSEVEWS